MRQASFIWPGFLLQCRDYAGALPIGTLKLNLGLTTVFVTVT